MAPCTLSRNLLQRSRLAERLPINFAPGAIETPLARMECDPAEAREWRITLGRADRHDGRPPNAPGSASNSSTLFPSQRYSYSAGFENTPADPPQRANPVAFAAPLDDFDPLFVQVAWGMDAATVNRLLAHWPMQGASMVVTGSFVEVFAGTFLVPDDPAAISQDPAPTLMAQITPSDGITVADAAELSIQQAEVVNVGIAAGDAAVVYVPEFARRVRVVAVDNVTGRVPDFGHPRLIGEWFAEDAGVCDGFAQGSSIGCCPEWQAVPARATLLRIGSPGPSVECMEPPFTSLIALVHWRIAP